MARKTSKRHTIRKPPARKPLTKQKVTAEKKASKASATKPKPSRPLVRASLGISLDGYLAAHDGTVDWLHNFFTHEIDFGAFARTIGATIMGRRTFDEALARGTPLAGEEKVLILTNRPLPRVPPNVTAISGDLRPAIARLRTELAATGKDIWLMGGGKAIEAMLAQDLVDRLEISIMPITLGRGLPLLPPHARGHTKLRLLESKAMGNGIVSLVYELGDER